MMIVIQNSLVLTYKYFAWWVMEVSLSYLNHPTSLIVFPQFVHLKKVIVEWIVSSAISTFQVSLSVWPHVGQTMLTTDNCLSDAAFLSMTAISTNLPLSTFILCLVFSCFKGFWYLHFGHLSEGVSFLNTWSNAPHCGQKSIVVTLVDPFLITGDFYVLRLSNIQII